MTVADSGDGVPEGLRDVLFEENVSGHPAGRNGERGLGLALVRQVARVADGDVWLADPGTDSGAVFVARLPGVLSSGESRAAPFTAERVGATAGTDRAVDLDGVHRR